MVFFGGVPKMVLATSDDTPWYIPTLLVPIPGLNKFLSPTKIADDINIYFLSEYINAMYSWLLGVAALVAVVMIMLGGLQYVLAAGQAKAIGSAKTRITNAITGLVLLLAAYNIAYLIDPNTTSLKAIGLRNVKGIPMENIMAPGDDAAATGTIALGQSDWQDCMLNTFGATEEAAKARQVSVSCKGTAVQVHELIAEDFKKVCAAIENDAYNISSFGGMNWRVSKGNANVLSAHSWGVAFDINPGQNPFCRPNPSPTCIRVPQAALTVPVTTCPQPCQYDIPESIVAAFEANGFVWGGKWKSAKDYMHFSTKKFCGGAR